MLLTLTEQELKNIIEESLIKYKKGCGSSLEEAIGKVLKPKLKYLTEMALHKKEYKQKVDGLSSQIIENWCLIRHCRLYKQKTNLKHWKDELKGHLLTVARANLKGSNTWEDKEQAIREVWNSNDYFTPKSIVYTIHNKFRKEGFDTDSVEFLQIVNDCINSFNTLIHLISLGEIPEIYQYVDSL